MAEPTPNPSRKVVVGGLAGALVTLLAWISKAYAHVDVPAEVALGGLTIFTFALQYLVPNKGESDG